MITGTDYQQPIQSPEQINNTPDVNQSQNVTKAQNVGKVNNSGGATNATGINNLDINGPISSGVRPAKPESSSVAIGNNSHPTGQVTSQKDIPCNITGPLAGEEAQELTTFFDQDTILKLIDSDLALKNMVDNLKSFYMKKPDHNVLHVLCAIIYNFFLECFGKQTTTLGQDDLAKQALNMLKGHPEILIFYNSKNMTEDNFLQILNAALKKVNDQKELLTDDELKLYPKTILEVFKQFNTPDFQEMSKNMYDNLQIMQESFMPLIEKFQDKISFNGKEPSGALLFKDSDEDADNELTESFNQALDSAVNTWLEKLDKKAGDGKKTGNFCLSQFNQRTTTGEKRKDEIKAGMRFTYGNTVSAEDMTRAAAEYVFGMACNDLDHKLIPDLDQKFDHAALKRMDAHKRSTKYLLLRTIIARTIENRIKNNRRKFETYQFEVSKQEDAKKMLVMTYMMLPPDMSRLKKLCGNDILIKIDQRYLDSVN